MVFVLAFSLPSLATISPTIDEPELLAPEQAFQLTAKRLNSKTVELNYQIAKGYYMYKGRFKYAAEPSTAAKLGKATLGKGKLKQDPTFGRVEIYRDSVRILLPVTNVGAAPLKLKITSQGCADVGVCYPPFSQTLTFASGNLDAVFPDDASNVSRFTRPATAADRFTQPK
jgi:thioredoxin:protein disulfide reductase